MTDTACKMSDTKFPSYLAWTVGLSLMELLRPYCVKGFLAVTGSLRRGQLEVGDVEICYVSKVGPIRKPGEMFASQCLLADEFINQLLVGKLEKRLSETGHATWGAENKLAVHKATGLPVDLFRTTEEDWARTLVIRTGPKNFNIRLIQSAAARGLELHAYGNSFTRVDTGEVVPCRSEREVFELAGVEWLEPEERG